MCSAVQLVGTHEKTSSRPIMVIRMYCSREKCSLRAVESCARHSAIAAARKAAPNLTKASTCTLLSARSCGRHMGVCTQSGPVSASVSSAPARQLCAPDMLAGLSSGLLLAGLLAGSLGAALPKAAGSIDSWLRCS